jgi:hypothetical protein
MDAELRVSLWNVLRERLFGRFSSQYNFQDSGFVKAIWKDHFKRPVDDAPDTGHGALIALRRCFDKMEWTEVYEFVEFVLETSPYISKDWVIAGLNEVLKRENSAYRIVGGKVIPIITDHEIKAIDSALYWAPRAAEVHLNSAIAMLSDRVEPDYRNSIKESISAVEAICKIIAADDKADLAKALRALNAKISLHGALRMAFDKLYAYTNDE